MRVLIGALSGQQYADRREQCLATWMSDADDIGVEAVFLVGDPDVSEPTREGRHLLLPCPDEYETLPQRTRWFCKWALSQPGWDYLFKCDDDTYVSVPRLVMYDPMDRDYIGAEYADGVGYASGGGGYLLSRRAAKIVAEKLTQETGAEDRLVGALMRDEGIPLSKEPRFLPHVLDDSRPDRDNDAITVHTAHEFATPPERFVESHRDTGLDSLKAAWCDTIIGEVGFWNDWLDTKGSQWPDDYARRMQPHTPLCVEVEREVARQACKQTWILEVGSGPLSAMGNVSNSGAKLTIMLADPLSGRYGDILVEHDIVPPDITPTATEQLAEYISNDSQDIVFARNCIDHGWYPLLAIQQMLAVTRPGGVVILKHRVNEATRQRHAGMHQWDLYPKGDELYLGGLGGHLNISEHIADVADTESVDLIREVGDGEWLIVLLRKHEV